jgi:hypothetical protein
MPDFGPAIDRLRDIAKYLIGAFAAVAALLIGTSPLSGLGALEADSRLVVAVCAALVALMVVAKMVAIALSVLMPISIPFREIPDKPEYAGQRAQIENEDAYLFDDDYPDIAKLFAKRSALQAEEMAAKASDRPWHANDDSAVVLSKLLKYGAFIQDKMVYLAIEANFKELVRYLRILFPVISIALVAFTWAVGSKGTSVDLDVPIVVAIPSSTDNKLTLKNAGYAEKCLREPQRVVVFRERSRWNADGIMVPGDADCKTARVTLSDVNRIVAVKPAR